MNTMQALSYGPDAPVDLAVGGLWFSTAIAHSRVADGPAERAICISPNQSYEGTAVQEPSVWYLNGKWHMLYTASNVGPIAYAYNLSPDPRQGEWVKAGLVFSPGGGALHTFAYIEGDVGYLYYPNSALSTVSVAVFDARDPTIAFGAPTVIFSSLPYNWTLFGNPCMVKANGVYYLMQEGSVPNRSWQVGLFVGSSPTGTFTPYTQITPTSWAPNFLNDNPTASGGCIVFENGKFTIVYHGGPNRGEAIPTEIYRATSVDLVAYTPDFSGRAFVVRALPEETDQVADPHFARGPSGTNWLFWSGLSNRGTLAASIVCAPMYGSIMAYNGVSWDYAMTVAHTLPEPGYVRHASKTANTTLLNRDEVFFDTQTGGFTATFPAAAAGAYVRVANYTSGVTTSNVVTPTAAGADVFQGSAGATLAVGESRDYRCYKSGVWCRT